MKFFDLHVHNAFSGGESTLEELAKTSKLLGYWGICFVFYYQEGKEEELYAEIEKLKQSVNMEIYLGFEARSARELRELVKNRRKFDLLLVRGGNIKLNRLACQTPEVDILTHPEYERNDSGLDHISARFAAENDVAIEINFREILISNKATRAKVLAHIKRNVMLAKKYHAPIVLCSGGITHWELRSPECLISMATLLGLDIKEAKEAISKVPERIVMKAKERRSKNWIMPGVRIVG